MAVDYEAWAIALSTLLDLIEQNAFDADEVRRLCAQRFDIAREHGVRVEFTGEPGSRAEH